MASKGFRNLLPLAVQPSITPGFRPITSTFDEIPLITSGPQFDNYTDLSNYVPTYIPIPQTYYNPNKGIYEQDGREILDDSLTLEGPSFEDSSLGKGNYVTASDILGPPAPEDYGHPGISDTQKSSGNDNKEDGGGYGSKQGGMDFGGSVFNSGGMVPPVYAETGLSPAQLATDEALERYERERKKKEEEEKLEKAAQGLSLFDLFTGVLPDPATKILGLFNAATTLKNEGPYGFVPDVAKPAVNKIFGNEPETPSVYPNQKGIDPKGPPITYSAYDPSPNNKNPATGETITAQSGTIPGGKRPEVNLGLTTSGGMTLPMSMTDVYNASQSGTYTPAFTDGIPKIDSGYQADITLGVDAAAAYSDQFKADLEAEMAKIEAEIAAAKAGGNSKFAGNDNMSGKATQDAADAFEAQGHYNEMSQSDGVDGSYDGGLGFGP